MNININEIKNGMTIIIDGKLCLIEEFQHVKPGKGGAFRIGWVQNHHWRCSTGGYHPWKASPCERDHRDERHLASRRYVRWGLDYLRGSDAAPDDRHGNVSDLRREGLIVAIIRIVPNFREGIACLDDHVNTANTRYTRNAIRNDNH